MDVYLLPGLGADHRLYERMMLKGHERHALDWPELPLGSTLADFAKALAQRVDRSRPHALIGVSMGGMVAQELAALTAPQRVIIISSWKGPAEMPTPIRLLRGTHPERVLTRAFMQHSLPFMRWQMGVEGPEEIALFDALLNVHTVAQLKVQINACLNWAGPPRPVPGLVHIHGDHDRLMPFAHVKDALVVKGGGHFMVHNRAAEVEKLVLAALN